MSGTQWAVSAGGSAGGGAYLGAQGLALTVIDVAEQIRYPILFIGGGLVAGFKGGISVSTESPNFFTTSEEISIDDFSGRAWFGSLEFTPGLGGSIAAISFNFDHYPDPIYIGGFQVGVSGGAGLSIGYIIPFSSRGQRVVGQPIAPGVETVGA